MRSFLLLATLALYLNSAVGQTDKPRPVADPAAGESKANVHRGDAPDLLHETQIGIRAPGYTGIVWYIPFDFWIRSGESRGRSAAEMDKAMGSLKQYTPVFIFVAKVSGLGAFEYVSPEQLAKQVVIRDAKGTDYPVVPTISDDAKNLAAAMKPILANAMGKAGENSAMLFFPANDKEGHAIADPKSNGTFSVVLKDVVNRPEGIYTWVFPLTSVSEPKYCPIGKEQVNANWKYCPWHGAALMGDAASK
jgi:hypothetical protein